ncbi:MAG TPA: hypothetical protein VK736_06300 [Candidatus Binatia bacterium]|nr:hypothetical protein [Candidatus Binatia bacterium]
MSQVFKVLGGAAALITAALVGGTLIGSVLAAPSGTASSTGDALFLGEASGETGEYCQVFLDTFADELGVSTDELAPAAKAAAIAAINQAVANGDLTQDVADRMIENVNNWDGDGCGWIGFRLGHWAHHAARVEFMSGVFESAAKALGMEVSELREALQDSTLEEVAEAQGVDYADVVAAALVSATADLDAAVEVGSITQEKADEIYARLETWLNEGGIGNWGEGDGRPGRGPGRHFFFAPPVEAPSDSTDSSSDGSAEGTSA